jgi:hypothetical protein
VGWKALKPLASWDFSEAAEGTRTLDLLHGKQTLIARSSALSLHIDHIVAFAAPVAVSGFLAFCRSSGTQLAPRRETRGRARGVSRNPDGRIMIPPYFGLAIGRFARWTRSWTQPQLASAFTECCRVNAGSDARGATGDRRHSHGGEPTGGALLDRAVPRPVRQGEVVGHQVGLLVGVVDDPV